MGFGFYGLMWQNVFCPVGCVSTCLRLQEKGLLHLGSETAFAKFAENAFILENGEQEGF